MKPEKTTYWVYFKVQTTTGSSEHTRVVNAAKPISYVSDVVALQDYCAREVGAQLAMVISWTRLDGVDRPQDEQAVFSKTVD